MSPVADDLIRPPWTDEQVDGLNAYQKHAPFHEFTCGNDDCRAGKPDPRSRYAPLRAARDGWVCDWCGYRQDWAFRGMPELGQEKAPPPG